MTDKIILTVTFILTLISTTCYAQHTDRFIKLTESLKPSDTSKYETKYKDGSLKEAGTYFYFETPDYTYSKKCGEIIRYYKNGNIKGKEFFDNYGNVLSKTFYNEDGSLWWKIKTIEIDSNLENLDNYFTQENHIIVTMINWSYKFGEGIGEMYLREKGKVKNGKKVGIWQTYTQRGQLEDEVNYDSK